MNCKLDGDQWLMYAASRSESAKVSQIGCIIFGLPTTSEFGEPRIVHCGAQVVEIVHCQTLVRTERSPYVTYVKKLRGPR
jgi:hypothetical protein